MTVEMWQLAVAVVIPLALTVGPAMFVVYGRLVRLATILDGVVGQLTKLEEADDKRLPMCIVHQERIADHERRLAILEKHPNP